MHLLTATKKSISAAELQRQLGHKRYQPIWEMMHKLRSVMGKRDDKYTLKGNIELDEGFFSTETPDAQKQEKLKAGAGSQKKSKVLVIAENTEPDSTITTDACTSHNDFKILFGEHKSQVIDLKDIGKVLPWVHIAIANAKTLFADMYHGIKPESLNEFCYKFNRRYFGEDLFDRLVMIAASYRTDFEHRMYNKKAA